MTNKAQPPMGERIAALEAVVPDMADKVDETHTMVHEMKGQLSTFIQQMAKADEREIDRAAKVEVRMRDLENGASRSQGARHVISGIVSAVVALVITYFGGGHYPAK